MVKRIILIVGIVFSAFYIQAKEFYTYPQATMPEDRDIFLVRRPSTIGFSNATGTRNITQANLMKEFRAYTTQAASKYVTNYMLNAHTSLTSFAHGGIVPTTRLDNYSTHVSNTYVPNYLLNSHTSLTTDAHGGLTSSSSFSNYTSVDRVTAVQLANYTTADRAVLRQQASFSNLTATGLMVTSNLKYPVKITGTNSQDTTAGYGIQVTNTSASGSDTAVINAKNSSSYTGEFGKANATYSAYKNILANTTYIYNDSSAGNIALLNDYASGAITLSAGGLSSPTLTVASTGKVGIGTATTPTEVLHVKGSGTGTAGRVWTQVETSAADSAAGFKLKNSAGKLLGAQISSPSYITGESASFYTEGAIPLGFATDGGISSGGTSPIIFSAGGYAASNERMRISTTGVVSVLGSISTPAITTNAGDSKLLIGSTSAYDNGNHRIGIGTTSPASTLHVHAPDSSGKASAIGSSLYSSIDSAVFSSYSNSVGIRGVVAGNLSGYRASFTGIKAGGSLAAPTAPLTDSAVLSLIGGVWTGSQVQNSADMQMIVDGPVAHNTGGVTIDAPIRISYRTRPKGLAWYERMTIKSDGKVGIGTTTPRVVFDVASSATGKGRITVGSNTNYGVFDQALGLRYAGDTTTWDDMLVELVSENTDIYPSAGVLGAGADTVTSGTYQSLYKKNGVNWIVSESTSAGNMIDLTFEDNDQPPSALIFTGKYIGTGPHATGLVWNAWDYVAGAWDTAVPLVATTPFATGVTISDVIVTGFLAKHRSSTGLVRVALNHTSNGITTHSLSLDEVRLIQDNQPTSQYYKGGRIQSYRNTGYDMGHYKGQATHAYKTGTDWKWHVHFTTESVIPNRAIIKFRNTHTTAGLFKNFSAAIIDATFTNNSATRLLYNIPHTAGNIAANVHLLVGGDTDVKGTNFTISTIVAGEIKRLAGTYIDPVLVLYTDFHLEIDSTGSNDVYIKNNTP